MQFVDVRPAARLTGADAEGRIVAWRLHVSGIAAMDLPDAAAYGRHEWMGFVLRFTATWSGESKRTSVAPSQGGRSHSWAGEHTTLALPSVVGDSVPESELDIALCARIVGKPDEIIGAAKAVESCEGLTETFGPRVTAPQMLRDMAAKGQRFYPAAGAKAA